MLKPKRISIWVGALFCLLSTRSIAQENPGNFAKMSDFLPPSPNASELGKYGGATPNFNTGAVNVSIPLIPFAGKFLSLNTSIQYSNNGIRVEEIASRAGMGWALNAGGVITRTVMGVADELATNRTLIASPNVASRQFFDIIESMSLASGSGGYDGQADIFTFNFNGYAGKFVLDESLNVKLVPHSNFKIEKNFFSTDWNFCITAPDGVKYYFGGSSATEESRRVSGLICSKNYDQFIPTAWYLKSIVHPLGDQMIFNYTALTPFQYPGGRSQIHYFTPPAINCVGGNYPQLPYVDCTYEVQVKSVLLESIQTSHGGRLKFYYSTRTDCGDRIVNRMELINDNKKQILEAYNFTYTTYANKIPFLTKVAQISSTTYRGKEYQMQYHSPSLLPAPTIPTSFKQDHWGFFNNKNNTTLIQMPSDPYLQSKFPLATADRSPDINYTQSGMLTAVIYPTGGKDVFTYEANTFWNTVTSSNEITGGVRVATISTEDGSGTAMLRKYYYSDLNDLNKSSATNLPSPNYYKEFMTREPCTPSLSIARYYTTISLQSSSIHNLYAFSSTPLSYASVIEGHGTNFQNGGIQYKYSSSQDTKAQILLNGDIPNAPFSNTGYQNGQLLETYEFSGLPNTSDPSHKAVKKVVNVYKVETRNAGSRANWLVNRKYADNAPPTVPPNAPTSLELESLDVVRYYLDTKWMYMESSTQSIYDQNGQNPVSTQTKFFYDNQTNLMLTRTEKVDSKLQTDKTILTYPHDYPGVPVYDAMISRNIIDRVVQFSTLENTTTTSVTKTNYSLVGSNSLALPQNIQKKILTGNFENEGTFDLYDEDGNLIQYTEKNGVPTCYVWGYNKKYVVAKIVGAIWEEVVTKVNINAIQTITDETLLQNALNNLRTLPKAFVTTIAYKPMVGVSSEKDPTGTTIFYEYDALGRLTVIRDNEKKVVKKICYNYNGQPEACSIFYNEATSLVYTKQCESPYVGTSVTYYVPANSYISMLSLLDANAMASAEVTANGQEYANTVGSCNIPCTPQACTGVDKKCINGNCETGIKVYTSSIPIGGHMFSCTYHYEWSDGSWSDPTTVESPIPCLVY